MSVSRFTRGVTSNSGYSSRTISVNSKEVATNEEKVLKLTFSRILGKGTFGCIEQAHAENHREPFAIKRVFQDPRYKNRELGILLKLSQHPNLVRLIYYYYTTSGPTNSQDRNARATRNAASNPASNVGATTDPKNEIYLNLVMECFPESLGDLILRYIRHSQKIPMFSIKLYVFQMMRALGYIHMLNICHRDIKSSNLLVNEQTGQVKLCDFGSAKELIPGQTNVAYISSRYYRAPELIFGAEMYNCAIDVWSGGCVVAELLLRKCLFMGSDSLDQLGEIIKVLGSPTVTEVQAMNPKYSSYNFPNVPRCPLKLYLPKETPADLVNLLSEMLVYRPHERIKPFASLRHAAFSVLQPQEGKSSPNLPNGAPLPSDLFRFLPSELECEPKLKLFDIQKGDEATSSSTSHSDKMILRESGKQSITTGENKVLSNDSGVHLDATGQSHIHDASKPS